MPTLLHRVNSSRSTVSKDLKCVVQLLDDSQTVTVEFKKDDTGQVVFDYVCDMLNLAEKDYFGLRYVDANRHRYWLDTTKPILRQVTRTAPIVFAFRVKFYPVDPTILHEQLTRYLVTLQLRRDLLHGRLYCPQNDAAVLGAYIVQAELGDYDPAEHQGNYVSQFKIFLYQTPRLEEKIASEHQLLKGKNISQSDAELEFLKKASQLETYGYYPFTVKDHKDGQRYLGSTPRGLMIYQAHKKLHHLRWNDIKGFDYTGKEFSINVTTNYADEHEIGDEEGHATDEEKGDGSVSSNKRTNAAVPAESNKNNAKKEPRLRVICPSATFCKHLWKYMLGQQAFFTKHKGEEVKPVVIRRGPFLKRATFRYAGRVLEEIKESASPKRAEPAFERIHIQRQLTRDERSAPWVNKFHTLPRAMKAVPEEEPGDILNHTAPAATSLTMDSLLLDTTAQATPATTPMRDMSPSVANSLPLTTPTTSKTVKSSNAGNGYIGNGQGGRETPSLSPSSDDAARRAYQSEVITVCLKRVEQRTTTTTTASNATQQQRKTDTNGFVTSAMGNSQQAQRENSAGPQLDAFAARQAIMEKRKSISSGWTWRAFARTILTGLMFVILAIVAVIFVMEIQDRDFRRYLRELTGNDAFRRNIYNPLRRRVVDGYGRMF